MRLLLLPLLVSVSSWAGPTEVILRPGGEGVVLRPSEETHVRCESNTRRPAHVCDIATYKDRFGGHYYVTVDNKPASSETQVWEDAFELLKKMRASGFCD